MYVSCNCKMCTLFPTAKCVRICFHLLTCQMTCQAWAPPMLALKNMYTFLFCKTKLSLNNKFHLNGPSTSYKGPYMTNYLCIPISVTKTRHELVKPTGPIGFGASLASQTGNDRFRMEPTRFSGFGSRFDRFHT